MFCNLLACVFWKVGKTTSGKTSLPYSAVSLKPLSHPNVILLPYDAIVLVTLWPAKQIEM